jgi:hypothetical protein
MFESLKQRIKEKEHRQAMQETGGMPQSASFHRPAYHRNFQGYTEVTRLDEKGKTVIRRIYTGKYYVPALSRQNQLRLRFVYAVLFLGGGALYFFCAMQSALCNAFFPVNLLQGLSLPLLLWCLYLLAFYLPSTGKLTLGDYETLHRPLIRASLLTALCMWATAVAGVVACFVYADLFYLSDLPCVGGFALSGGLMFLIYFLEHRLEYLVEENDTEMPADGVELESN